MARLFIYILLIYFGYLIFKSLGKHLLGMGGHGIHRESSGDSAEMIKDPQCGAYFLRQRGFPGEVRGKTVYFCSEECRDTYIKRNR